MSLQPCAGCQRHVRIDSAACPFCGAAFVASEPAPKPVPTRRLGRAALLAFGASLAVSACGGSLPLYGGPPRDAGPPHDAGHDAAPVPAYGAPVPDAGHPPPQQDAGGIVPAYGAPIPEP